MSSAIASRAPQRRVPRFGGFNGTLLGLEVRRLTRNRRTMIFSVVLPVVFFLLFGTGKAYSLRSAGPHGNWAASIMISMALYGAMLSTTAGGAMVATERSQGWSRQLRLTPLTPAAYIVVKVLVAMLLGAVSVAVTYAAGGFTQAHMDGPLWVETALIAWVGSLVFAAFGVFMGYLLPSENVMQILGPGLALLAFLGGLFTPLDQLGSTFQTIAKFTPMYGLSELAHAPIAGTGPGWTAVVNVVFWLALFAGGAAWRFRRDTARV
ncbi:ABC-2 type transport system permease protein [Phycicoccus badiiscoriae]|uniref:ABC-2 type transport system permease protein n=1 Tax=Pedococcus badiiscoriae TaxID=642776 RepID=A0A852WH98_9MICO|nr:ABC transporter permease [Pedococcus badiiscoriae]NYG08149.1 ABC-2 type transport system permease protein [Pedococcus badiiscoriae]